ncbi:hypothetical protein MAL08_19975 (plasmid) [Leptospira noguchii]|uniref:hypothetical protein n=1 Tax=Leptospira noguchii TaxID=28182 RepID=UPI000562C111|nr:hypothetical protein [Leptospira noguchii]UOG40024.1 hypothetical protein MAL08_19975 [Leptospira noguchii]
MDPTITSAAIATIISASLSALISLYIAGKNNKKYLDDQLDSILKIAVQYPYLENRSFTETWSKNIDQSDEKYLRYDVYCTLIFNYLERLCKYYNYKLNSVNSHIAIKDWVRLHKKYWNDPLESYENIDTYEKEFRFLIEDFLNGGK